MAAQELRWLTYLLTDLGEPPRSPPVLYVDNKAMLALCREQRLEHRTKHIALRYFLARELQQRGQLRLAYVASEANTADVFTKALAPCDHQRCCTQLGLLCFVLPDWSCDPLFSPTLPMGVMVGALVTKTATDLACCEHMANSSPEPSLLRVCKTWLANGRPAAEATILVTGGAGYIGSHTCVQLLQEGYSFDAVVHFAGLKAVGESVKFPLKYYQNNVTCTLNLLEVMSDHGCKKIVFSSSATVYGQPKQVPCTENDELQTLNPYGRSKLYIERVLEDVYASDATWSIVLLRYFNPVGAHPSGRIGEDPRGIPNNLMPPLYSPFPFVVRDYIHVMDLAAGHAAALRRIFMCQAGGCDVYNLGTGKGTTVLEMVAGFERACGQKLPVKLCPRRPGDCSEVFASTDKAQQDLDWRATRTVEDMCRDQWNWARQNPMGYAADEDSEEGEESGGER
ncbi:unnamed protein product, partial [Closterium sp. NIES-53]